MAVLDFAHREITAKVVYFGAPDAGVSTNVEQLAAALAPGVRSDLHRFGPEGVGDPSLCFEYVVPDLSVRGFPLRLQVYGVPGGLHHARLRRDVLERTDAVVFVADARRDREQANIDSMLDLEAMLRERGIELAGVPMVLQVNHADASQARPERNVVVDLNPYGFPVHRAVARRGEGVARTHRAVVELLLERLDRALGGERVPIVLDAVRRTRRETIRERVAQHLDAYRAELEAAARAADPRVRYAGVPLSDALAVPYQPENLRGTRPVAVLAADLDGPDVVVEIVHERVNGGEPRRIRLRLENRPRELLRNGPEAARLPEFSACPAEETDVTANLPDHVEIVPQARDWPPVAYGVVGVVCGVLIGFLLGVVLLL